MSTESVTSSLNLMDSTVLSEWNTTLSTVFNSSEPTTAIEVLNTQYATKENDYNASNLDHPFDSESPIILYETFLIVEIVMTTVELIVSIAAAIKIPKWKRNYRNQMLMQLSVARFIKRVVFLLTFLKQCYKISSSMPLDIMLDSTQIYIDFVIVILVFFFIKHMYDTLIIVLINIRQNKFLKVLAWSWFLPLPISVVWTTVIYTQLLDRNLVYFLICFIFRWPLILVGTALYITILYKVMTDKIRKFARSLTVVTFLLCLVINFYLLSKDILKLWCINSFTTNLISYISGFLMNFLILGFYIVLIILCFRHNNQPTKSLPDYSVAIEPINNK